MSNCGIQKAGTRVLMITSDHLMIDRRIIQEARTLVQANYEVTLLAGFECSHASDYELDGIRIKRFSYDWSDVRVERVLKWLTVKPGPLRTLAWLLTRRLINSATRLTSFEHYVLRQILNHDYDVLHCHDFPLLAVAVEAAKRRPVPLVYDAHELYHAQVQLPTGIQRKYRRREKRLIRRTSLNITVNPFISAIMERDYKVEAPAVIMNAAQPVQTVLSTFHDVLRMRLAIPQDHRIVLYQGWMSPERGIDKIVRSAAYFPSNIHLVLIGYGAHEAELRAINSSQGTDDGRVFFLGEVPSNELAQMTMSADIGIIPYHGVDLNNYYCSPNKLFEFAVSGVPFISNDLPFLRTIVNKYGFGVLANLSDPREAAQAIVSIVTDDAQLSLLKAAAREASKDLNWSVEGQKLIELYRQRVIPEIGQK